ncbi:MAG TPA: hypothetical protein VFE72_02535 [Lysobacter sp.]|nr:hypothetical protein [Lysobacter sp.]
MNDDRSLPLDEDRALSDALRWQLRAQRRDIEPANDLWAGIAARLEPPKPRVSRRTQWYALAASLLLAVTAGVLLRPPATTGAADAIARQEAVRMKREYDAALRHMPDASKSREFAPAMAELDRSAREIRRALDHAPDSRLLLDQLRRTYSLRLELSQRAALS